MLSHALVCLAATFAAAESPNVDEIVRNAISREVRNQRKLTDYTWEQVSVVKSLSNDAALKKTETKVTEHFNIDGSSYKKVIEKDGKPLSSSEARKEQEKMDKEIAKRKNESAAQRQKRMDDERKERDEAVKFREELMHAFTFHIEGEDKVNGFTAWRIGSEPRMDFKPKSRDGKMLSKVHGRIWVEKTTGEWLKFEVETLEKLTFGGFLATVAPGATIAAQQMRVNDELWHPEWFKVHLNARALWKKFNADAESTFRNFRKFQAESRIVDVTEVEKK